jgi:WD40 repeat protein
MCLSEFQSIVTKEKMILQTLKDYGLIKSYDLRSNFGGESADLPECDSDLENEEFKGMESLEVKDSRYDQAEINGYKISKSTELDRMKQGIDFSVVKQDQTLFEYDSSLAEKSETNAQKTKLLQWRKQVAKSQSDQTDNVDSSIPGMYLELEYVYGYRCHDTRNNIAYSPSGDLIYHTAALGVVLNKKTNTQKFFTDHYDDVTCLVSFDTLIATGQVGKRPLISIWDSKTQALKGAINSPLRKGISHMDFSQDGKKLAAMSIDEFHSVAIFDVAKVLASKGDVNLSDCLLVWNVGPPSSVFHMCFDGSNNRLAFACKNGIWFGQIGSKQLEIKEGQKWSPACPKQSVLCLISMDYEVVAGTISGKLVIFKDEDLVSEKPAHKSAITAIHKRTNNRGFITGGNDAIIIIWDGNYNIV